MCIRWYACWAWVCVVHCILCVWVEQVEKVSVDKWAEMDFQSDTTLKQSHYWCMTRVALCHPGETALFCVEIQTFCYNFNFIITIVVHVWQRASCHSAHPLSFTAHTCSHVGALQLLLHTVWISRTKTPLWRTAQSRSNFLFPESPLDVYL